jgi:hypothetical protein
MLFIIFSTDPLSIMRMPRVAYLDVQPSDYARQLRCPSQEFRNIAGAVAFMTEGEPGVLSEELLTTPLC